MSVERRQYARFQVSHLRSQLVAADRASPCEIVDISAGGIFILTGDAMPVGMPVAVTLTDPATENPLKLTGRVVWALATRSAQRKGTRPGLRVRFDELPGSSKEQLETLLKILGGEIAIRSLRDSNGESKHEEIAPSPSDEITQVATQINDNSKMSVQVQGLMMQLGQLQEQLNEKEREIITLREKLDKSHADLGEALRAQRAAETAVNRLSMQISATRKK